MAKSPREMHQAEIYFDRDPVSGRWRIEWTLRLPTGRARHWKWAETNVEMDVLQLHRLCDLIRTDLESRLF